MSSARRHVSLLVVPEAALSTIGGILDALNCFPTLASIDDSVPSEPPFEVEIVGPTRAPVGVGSGLPVTPHRAFDEVARTDIVLAPALFLENGQWETGRHDRLVDWVRDMHRGGATLASACSGVVLLAETGLLDGFEATIHWAYQQTFRRNFPNVRLRQEKVLVTSGERQEFVMSGASSSWHDLVLFLVARDVGPTAAQAIAKFLMLQWHLDGQAPFEMFRPNLDHGDGTIRQVQEWLEEHHDAERPVQTMIARSGLTPRTFSRRFTKATGLSPIDYVQHVRVQEAKRRLERTDASVERIAFDVGYADPASFRRLFKRITGLPPGTYRRTMQLPDFARLP